MFIYTKQNSNKTILFYFIVFDCFDYMKILSMNEIVDFIQYSVELS